MSPALQVKLLRTLQTQEIERLWGTQTRTLDVRVLAATNQKLAQLVERGQFRSDLYYRFKRISIHLPPLRERQEDIPLLVAHFLQLIQTEIGKSIRGISDNGMELIMKYPWYGNVRELENCIRSAAALSRSDVILPEHLPIEIRTGRSINEPDTTHLESSLKTVLQKMTKAAIAEGRNDIYNEIESLLDKTLIELALAECSDNYSKTAELLGISRTTLSKKINQHLNTSNPNDTN